MNEKNVTSTLIKNGQLQKLPESILFLVTDKYYFNTTINGITYTIQIKTGLITDFGSIPGPLRWLFNPVRYIHYILHDAMYKDGGFYNRLGEFVEVSKLEADQVLYTGMIGEGSGKIESSLVFIGLFIGGGFVWDNYRKQQEFDDFIKKVVLFSIFKYYNITLIK